MSAFVELWRLIKPGEPQSFASSADYLYSVWISPIGRIAHANGYGAVTRTRLRGHEYDPANKAFVVGLRLNFAPGPFDLDAIRAALQVGKLPRLLMLIAPDREAAA